MKHKLNTLIPYCLDKSLKLISIGLVRINISLSLMFSWIKVLFISNSLIYPLEISD